MLTSENINAIIAFIRVQNYETSAYFFFPQYVVLLFEL